jgi:hypothetical protein
VNFAYYMGEIVRRFWRMSSAAVLAAAIAGVVGLGPAAAAFAAPVSSGGGANTLRLSGPSRPDARRPQNMFTVRSVSPGKGSTRGGYELTLEGSGFLPRTIFVTICGAKFSSNGGGVKLDLTGTHATFIAPPCTAGSTDIAVQSADIIRTVPFEYVVGKLPRTGPGSMMFIIGTTMIGIGSLVVVLFRRRPADRPRLT